MRLEWRTTMTRKLRTALAIAALALAAASAAAGGAAAGYIYGGGYRGYAEVSSAGASNRDDDPDPAETITAAPP